MRGTGTRFLIVGLLALLMFIPLWFVSAIIDDRTRLSEQTIREVGEEWGGSQLLSGPVLILPVEGPVQVPETVEVNDPATGQLRAETRMVTEIRAMAPVILLPETFELTLETESDIRSRGIFDVPVYGAEARIAFDFDTDAASGQLRPGERILWDAASLRVTVTANRALRGNAELLADGRAIPLEPRADGQPGIAAALGDPREIGAYDLTLGFNGAAELSATPMGRTSRVTITSDWPHPSFFGAFLPDDSEISDAGFSATWTIPHLARPLPQAARSDTDLTARATSAFGVRYFQPNDFYQKAWRAARYGILFIALTFLTVLLIEGRTGKPTHPVQYILIGLAQSVFVLLMVSYAEQIGFGAAYALSAGATTALLTLFGAVGLKLGRRTLVLAAMLGIIYAVLYLILRSADYALLAGSTLAFFALALTMIATRNEDWYGPATAGPRRPWFGKPKEPQNGEPEGTPPPPA
ncbi:cell envelope integrity protein CreD [Roseibacterium sp. SDUM158016]|uniref:cell envelope integrity protein CreD n=1 Tax=Roseicyclus sediminis TaxID=2980997 RepID=UPI0021D0FB2E|nr:cell envelope integrity protein CreD [Roseibacterium sp. SDUM158016]MCU4651246.1 cell envelope integrity protein CreD [Roseibacterium sp. SDUM158016]